MANDDNNMWIAALAVVGIVAVIAVFGMSSMTGKAVETMEAETTSVQQKEAVRPIMHVGPCAVDHIVKRQGVRLPRTTHEALDQACRTYRENTEERDRDKVMVAKQDRLLVREASNYERNVRVATDPCTVERTVERRGIELPRSASHALHQACRSYREKGGEHFVKPIRGTMESKERETEDRLLLDLKGACHMEGETCEGQCALNYACAQQNDYIAGIPVQDCIQRRC